MPTGAYKVHIFSYDHAYETTKCNKQQETNVATARKHFFRQAAAAAAAVAFVLDVVCISMSLCGRALHFVHIKILYVLIRGNGGEG